MKIKIEYEIELEIAEAFNVLKNNDKLLECLKESSVPPSIWVEHQGSE